MGNEQSDQHGILKESTIDDDPIIKNSQWSLHHAQMHKLPNPMSVFIGQENGSLENFAKVNIKNLIKIFQRRHGRFENSRFVILCANSLLSYIRVRT